MPEPEGAAVFAALSDGNRRLIVELLATGGPSTATGLAAELSISRQAAAKHLGLLADSGLAASRRVGRETHYQADLTALDAIRDWIATVEGEWQQRLDRLRSTLD